MKKRICILLPSISDEGGGVTEAARALVQGLYDSDEFFIEVLAFKSRIADDQVAMGRWPKVNIRLFSTYGPRAFCFSPAMMVYLTRRSYDLVHMHGIWMAHGLAAFIAQLKSIPTVISIHGMLDDWILARSKIKKALVGFLFQNRLLRNATVLHALTQSEIRVKTC